MKAGRRNRPTRRKLPQHLLLFSCCLLLDSSTIFVPAFVSWSVPSRTRYGAASPHCCSLDHKPCRPISYQSKSAIKRAFKLTTIRFPCSHVQRVRGPAITVLSSNGDNEDKEPQQQSLEDLPGPEDTTKENIRSLFALFNNALATGVPKIVAKRYANDAVLLPSTNGDPIMNLDAIEEFYADYLLQKPQKRILEGRVRIGYGWSEDAGICEITLQDPATGTARKVKARYSFVYVWEGHQWKILQHHSSILGAVEAASPGAPSISTGPMTTQRVENLFQLLEDAWEIGDADAVARRFVDDGLLLPLEVYEAPRRGFFEIRDYMEEFLLGRPTISYVARIQVSIDPSIPGHQTWAKDVGTFEITFQNDGSSLNARYALDYVLDGDGVWKISHFTISPLPQDWDRLRATWEFLPTAQPTVSPPSSAFSDSSGDVTLSQFKSEQQTHSILPPKVSEDQVQQWFAEWNNAMATGDARVVMNRYSPKAVLMTTMSERPKVKPQEILEFYQLFLWNRPQAKALESFVTISEHWCKDVGVLEYTLKKSDGAVEKVKERYSFLYSFDEAGGWRIAHHHCSIVPEGLKEMYGAICDSDDNSDLVFQ